MPINYVIGDITDATEHVVMHGVNCKGVFGSGVAAAIKNTHPIVRDEYISLNEHILGTCQFVNHNDQVWVNAHTQDGYGYDKNTQYASLDAILDCFIIVHNMMHERKLTSLAMPKIGCGLGGASWNDVKELLKYILNEFDVNVYELEKS